LGDAVLVAFERTAGRALRGPAHAAQQSPHVPGVVALAGQALDHDRDPGQGPQVVVEPVGLGALEQGALDPLELGSAQPGRVALAGRGT
jgi:hypothetical protein